MVGGEHCLPNVIKTLKNAEKISPNSGHTRGGGGGQDGKWSHFPPFFFPNPSLNELINETRRGKSR